MLNKRQATPVANASLPYSTRPIFQKYVFFNTAVFLGLGTMLLVLLITYYGLRILAGIQSPSKFETAKTK
jgi:hypothetical protein